MRWRQQYEDRINRVLNYIAGHLDEQLPLRKLADVKLRMTDVALEAGFAEIAEFSRAFRNQFGRTAVSWDRRSLLQCNVFRYVYSRICSAYGDTRLLDCYQSLVGWLATPAG